MSRDMGGPTTVMQYILKHIPEMRLGGWRDRNIGKSKQDGAIFDRVSFSSAHFLQSLSLIGLLILSITISQPATVKCVRKILIVLLLLASFLAACNVRRLQLTAMYHIVCLLQERR